MWYRRPLRWTRFTLIAYLLFVLLVTFLETWLVYPAPSAKRGDWIAAHLDREDIWFTSADGTRLHGWLLEHPNPRHVILYCHGNGEHVAYCAPDLDRLRKNLQATVFVFDYRGYGKSEGTPFEPHLIADGKAAHEWIAQRAGVNTGDVILIGRSLGGGVAIASAQDLGAKALVLQSTFARMVDTAAQLKPYLPVRLLMRNRWDSVSRIESYHGPVLQSHGVHDTLVTLSEARRLFEAIPGSQKEFLTYDGGHNDDMPPHYYQALQRFLDALPHDPSELEQKTEVHRPSPVAPG
jgi:fermentation-respiration switch protein FrsA (DUF1100 family)